MKVHSMHKKENVTENEIQSRSDNDIA